mmetsp:Transcript_43182/g.99932  ORF Transcript_43182/g.99932 Transcript_43182/m.99932 type:complete len:212 (+) Transcript_43182:1324-1959(+)
MGDAARGRCDPTWRGGIPGNVEEGARGGGRGCREAGQAGVRAAAADKGQGRAAGHAQHHAPRLGQGQQGGAVRGRKRQPGLELPREKRPPKHRAPRHNAALLGKGRSSARKRQHSRADTGPAALPGVPRERHVCRGRGRPEPEPQRQVPPRAKRDRRGGRCVCTVEGGGCFEGAARDEGHQACRQLPAQARVCIRARREQAPRHDARDSVL